MFEAQDGGAWRLGGALGVGDVSALHAAGLAAFTATAADVPLRVDLAAVTAADSAILALLVDWYAWARQQGRRLDYQGAPTELRALARLSEVDQWLFDSGA